MAHLEPCDHSSAPTDVPKYEITSRDDGVLQWNPPSGSKELALALSYYFPRQESLEDKMQAAILRYIRGSKSQLSQRPSRASLLDGQTKFKVLPSCHIQTVATDNLLLQTPAASHDADSDSQAPRTIEPVWDIATGEEMLGKRKKRQFTKEEQAEIIKNRGNACDNHRRRKRKCDAVDCPRHKQHENHLELDKDSSGIILDNVPESNSSEINQNRNMSYSKNTEVRELPRGEFRQETDSEEQLDQGRGTCPSRQDLVWSDVVPSSTSYQLEAPQSGANGFTSETVSEYFNNGDASWCFGILPEIEWDICTYSGTNSTDDDKSSPITRKELDPTAILEDSRFGMMSQSAEPALSEAIGVHSQIFPEGESLLAIGRFENEGENGPGGDLTNENKFLQTVSLPQLENSTIAGSSGYGGGGGGGSWGDSRLVHSCARDSSRGGRYADSSPQGPWSKESAKAQRYPNRSCRYSDHRPEQCRYEKRQDRGRDDMNHITKLMGSTSISSSIRH